MDERMMIPVPIVMPLGTPCNAAGVQDVWDTFVKPAQASGELQSAELRRYVDHGPRQAAS